MPPRSFSRIFVKSSLPSSAIETSCCSHAITGSRDGRHFWGLCGDHFRVLRSDDHTACEHSYMTFEKPQRKCWDRFGTCNYSRTAELVSRISFVNRIQVQTQKVPSIGSLIQSSTVSKVLNSIEVLINIDKGTRPPQNRLQKKINSARFVKNKDKLHELQTQLGHVMSSLNLDISVNAVHQ